MSTATAHRSYARGVRRRCWHPYSLPLVLLLLALQAYVLLPPNPWLWFWMAAPPSIVCSMSLIAGLLAINQPWSERWEFRVLLSVKMRWVPLVLLPSFAMAPFLSYDPALPHASAASAELAWYGIVASWILAYGAGMATALPPRLPGSLDPAQVAKRVQFLTLLLPLAALLGTMVLATRPVIH